MKLFLFSLLVAASAVLGEKIIENPLHTSWGRWFEWENCTAGQFAHGFQLSTHPEQGITVDDTANNGVLLFCDVIGGSSTLRPIISGYETKGVWGIEFFCPGFMSGFQFRSEAEQGAFIDDTAANNMRAFCNGNIDNYLVGDGLWFGDWTAPQFCDPGQAICAIQTQVEPDGPIIDQTTLNNIRFKCCDIPNPAEDCSPSGSYEPVLICDNTKSDEPRECSYEQRSGASYSSKIFTERPYAPLVYQEAGFTLENSLSHLEGNFKNSLGKSDSFDWTSAKNSFWTKSSVQKTVVKVEPHSRVEIHQFVGECGIYSVRSKTMKKVHKFTNKRMEKEQVTHFDF